MGPMSPESLRCVLAAVLITGTIAGLPVSAYFMLSRNNFTAPFETPTAGYDNLRMEIAFRQKLSPGLGFDELRFGLVGDNLLNDQMRNSASFKKNEILLPGRGFRAHLALRF